jgi:hypothetical protein
MPEPHDRLTTAFTDLASSILPEVRLPGPDAARATVRRRRRRRVALVAAAVALLILTPAATMALLTGSGGTGPDIGTTTAPPSPTTTPAPTGPPSPSTSPLRVIADANVREPTPLDDARLPLPSWEDAVGCPEGETPYTDGTWQGPLIPGSSIPVESVIRQVATGDVNQDGQTDWVALIDCRFQNYQGGARSQVVAFSRGGDGPYTLLGQPFLGDGNTSLGFPEVLADGTIRVVVGGPLEPAGAATYEWRSFRWTGSGFVPAGAPVAIPNPEPTDLTLTVDPATAASPAAVLTVTVHNGGASSDYLLITFRGSGELSIRPENWSADLQPIDVQHNNCGGPTGCYWRVRAVPVAPGQSASARFTVTFGGAVPDSLQVSVVGVTTSGWQENRTDQNSVTVTVAAG